MRANLSRNEHDDGMLLHLTRSMRIRVGQLVAFAYLFCVLAPAAALAWGHGPAPCLDEAVLTDVAPAYQTMPAGHVHGASSQDHAGLHAHHQAAQDAPVQHHHDGKGKAGACCGMMCVSALPAEFPSVAKPLQPTSACTVEITASLHSEAPPQLYRPPIA